MSVLVQRPKTVKLAKMKEQESAWRGSPRVSSKRPKESRGVVWRLTFSSVQRIGIYGTRPRNHT